MNACRRISRLAAAPRYDDVVMIIEQTDRIFKDTMYVAVDNEGKAVAISNDKRALLDKIETFNS